MNQGGGASTQTQPTKFPKTTKILPRGAVKESAEGHTVVSDQTGILSSVLTKGRAEAHFTSGKLSTIRTATGTTITYASNGARTVVREGVSDPTGGRSLVVSTGPHIGYVERTYRHDGHNYMRRTHVSSGRTYATVYRQHTYRGIAYYEYVPAYYYGTSFYSWADGPWPTPVYWNWGGAPIGYSSPNLWMADYLLNSEVEAPAGGAVGVDAHALTCGLGNRWAEEEAGFPSTWTRRGASGVFDAIYPTAGVSTVNRVTLSGNRVYVARTSGTDNNICSYEGTMSSDGKTISGSYTCRNGSALWKATVICDGGIGASSTEAQMTVDGPSDRLGTRWIVEAAGLPSTWTRRGTSDVFDGIYPTAGVSTINRVTMTGNGVHVMSSGSDGNSCSFEGTIGPDGVTIMGSLSCRNGSASWKATVVRDSPVAPPPGVDGPTAASSGPVSLTPEVKQAVAEAVKTQLEAQATAETNNNPHAVVKPAELMTDKDELPPALSPDFQVFIVASNLDVSVQGQACSLSPGDIITRVEDTPGSDKAVEVKVTVSRKNDCATGSRPRVLVADLQEMHNRFLEQMDQGLKTLAENQGKSGIPKGPAAGSRENREGVVAPQDAAKDATEVAEVEAEADQAEKEVRQAVASGGPQ